MRNHNGFTIVELVFAAAILSFIMISLIEFSSMMATTNNTARDTISMQTECQNAMEWMIRGRSGTDDGIRAATSVTVNALTPSTITFTGSDGLNRVFRASGTNLVFDNPVTDTTETLASNVSALTFVENGNTVSISLTCNLAGASMTLESLVYLRN